MTITPDLALALSGGVRVVVNTYLPPDAMMLMPRDLTPDEQITITDAMTAARARGASQAEIHRAGTDALIATGKVGFVMCGTAVGEELQGLCGRDG